MVYLVRQKMSLYTQTAYYNVLKIKTNLTRKIVIN